MTNQELKRPIERLFEFSVGERVHDDLTNKETTVIGVSYHNGYTNNNRLRNACHTVGYWVDNDYLDGGRHPWELSKLRRRSK